MIIPIRVNPRLIFSKAAAAGSFNADAVAGFKFPTSFRSDLAHARIADDGSGFNPGAIQSKGLGLRIMRYRAQMMAGSLRIESARARGTTVSCWFPKGAG